MENDKTYIDELGLSGEPFLSGVSEASFLSYDALSQCLELLREVVAGNDRLVVVKGGKGSGKTLLLKQLLASDEQGWRTCTICPGDPEADGCASAAEYDAYLFESPSRSVVMMDDAHLLSMEDLEFLMNIAGIPDGEGELGQIILFGQPDIFHMIDALPFDLPVTCQVREIEMPPLDKTEVKAYIQCRFRAAGYRGALPFTSGQLKDIYEISGGIPGLVNEVGQEFLESGAYQVKKSGGFFGFFSR